MEIKEGYMPFMGYQTYYRIVGKTEEGKSPIILLHGGPGSTHNYFELLDRVAESGRAVIMYDQLGCGKSYVATLSWRDIPNSGLLRLGSTNSVRSSTISTSTISISWDSRGVACSPSSI